MSDFTSDAPTSSVSDPSKRVRYSTGLVLGVDEFTQDQAYFMERDRLLTRALHGYGIVQGLRAHLDSSEDLLQVRVEPGLLSEPILNNGALGPLDAHVLAGGLDSQARFHSHLK